MIQLDDKDRRLLAALKRNARASLVSLARDIDLSRSATHDRLLRLEEKGIIKGYTVITSQADLSSSRAFLAIQFCAGADNRNLADKIAKLDGVCASHCISGDIDMLVEIEGRNSAAVAELRETIAAIDMVAEIRTHTILTSVSS